MRLAGHDAIDRATIAATATANKVLAPASPAPKNPGSIFGTLPHDRPRCYGRRGRGSATMAPTLRLTEDILANDSVVAWPARGRMIFVVHGSVTVAGKTLGDGEAWHSEDEVSLHAGDAGATLWRWELSRDASSG